MLLSHTEVLRSGGSFYGSVNGSYYCGANSSSTGYEPINAQVGLSCGGCSVGWNGGMESTATDAMPDDTDQTSQQPTSTPAEVATAQEETNSNPVMELALKDLQARRDALEAEIAELTSRKNC